MLYMQKQRSTKRVDYLLVTTHLNSLLERMYEFRLKYSLSEPSMWDIVQLFLHHLNTSKGCTTVMLTKRRYRAETGYQAVLDRVNILIKKGLVRREKNLLYPTELVYSDLEKLVNP